MSDAFDDYRNLIEDRDQLRAHNEQLRADLSESRCLLESSEAALQEAQRALYRWLPNRIGSEYDDLIAADAMTLMGLGSVDGLREIGGEILIELVEKRRLLDEARAQKPYGYEIDWPLSDGGVDKILTTDADDIEVARANRMEMLPVYAAAPVPAQPAAPDFIPALYSWLARAHFDRQQDEVTASRFGQQLHAWITAQPAVCDDCGALCTPANNAKSHIKRCAACQSAFVASLDSAITAQPAAVPEAVAKDVSALDDAGQSNRKVAYAWFPLLISRKRQLISDCGITMPQALTESDSQWAMRALLAMLERAECRSAILSAADAEVKNNV